MKKSFLIVLGLVVAFASLFVSCNDDNGGNNGVASCTVSVTATEGGIVTIENYSGNTAVLLAGNTVKFIATPNEGYQFVGWYIDGSKTPVSTELIYSFIANKDVAYVAKFEKLYAISVHSTANGSVAFKDAQDNLLELLIGSEVTVIATPDESTDFIGWYIGDSNEPVSTEAIYTFTVAENVTLVAKFNKWPLVSISSGGNGTVSFENSSELSQYIQIGEDVTVVAIPNEKCEFIGWFIGDSETAISTDATYTFTVSENVALVAKFEKIRTYLNGYEYVDLGLPSGLKWAAYNVGATKPEEYGGYVAWGETYTKNRYSANGSVTYGLPYSGLKNHGIIGSDGNLTAVFDVARAYWGGDWRMPTTEEQRELLNNCTWQWTTLNGVNGYKVTGPNGNSVFLPAAGYRNDTSLGNEGSYGYYWSSTPDEDESSYACYLAFTRSVYVLACITRYNGLTVRAVLE